MSKGFSSHVMAAERKRIRLAKKQERKLQEKKRRIEAGACPGCGDEIPAGMSINFRGSRLCLDCYSIQYERFGLSHHAGRGNHHPSTPLSELQYNGIGSVYVQGRITAAEEMRREARILRRLVY